MKKLLCFAAALLVLVGCNESKKNVPAHLVTITGGIELKSQQGPSKVIAREGWEDVAVGDDVEFIWEEGDVIAVLSSDFQEIKSFTVSKILEGGAIAEFTGEPLSGGMESYLTAYPYKFGEAYKTMIAEGKDDLLVAFARSQQYTGKLKPDGLGNGESSSFTINSFMPIIDLSLTGNVTLGKIDYYFMGETGYAQEADASISMGDGLLLTDQSQHVTFAPFVTTYEGFKLEFYDTNNQLIMTKESYTDLSKYERNQIISFPVLEVKSGPTDVFNNGAKMNFKLTFDAGWKIFYYEFNYTNNGSGFTCDKIIENGDDKTSEYASMCPVTLTGNYTFHFQLGSKFTLDYDGANKTYKCGGEYSPTTTITDFKVNDVSIFDQLTDITE